MNEIAWGFNLRGDGSENIELDIYDVIGESLWYGGVSAKSVRMALKQNANAKTIKVRMNTRGGDVVDGLAIYNQLNEHKARVEIDVDALAASMGSVILMAGDERRVSENALVMLHDPIGGTFGRSNDLRNWADVLDKMRDELASIYSARSGMTAAKVRQLMDKTTYLSATEAKELGLVDVVKSNKASAKAFAYLNLFGLEGVPEGLSSAVALARAEHLPHLPSTLGQQPGFQPPAPVAPKERIMSKYLALLTAMGLSAEASDEAAAQAFNAMKPHADLGKKLLAKTGDDNGDAALGKVDAWKEQAAKVPELEKQVGESKAASDKGELDTLVRKGQDDKKLTPDQATKLRAKVEACFAARAEMKASGKIRDLTDDEWTLGQAKAYVEALPVNSTLGASGGTPPAPPAPGAGSSGAAEAMKHNGKAYEEMSGLERVKLHDTDKASFDMVRNDWVSRGEPSAPKKTAP